MKAIPALFSIILAVFYQAALAADPAASAKLPADLVAVPNAAYAPLIKLAEGSKLAQTAQQAAVEKLGLPVEVRSAKSGINFRLIPAGTFTMGSPPGEEGRYDNEVQHQETLTKPFYCGKYPITQGQWQAVMGNNPSRYKNAGADAPVELVSWDDCQAFLAKLCAMEGVAAGTYRLLTEAQWEYACRAGTGTATYGALGAIAWYTQNSGDTTHPVGQKQPNAYGLYDMIGNVWQWCGDWNGDYPTGAGTDTTGAASGKNRVFRGASWFYDTQYCRAAYRANGLLDYRSKGLGLRILRLAPGQSAAE